MTKTAFSSLIFEMFYVDFNYFVTLIVISSICHFLKSSYSILNIYLQLCLSEGAEVDADTRDYADQSLVVSLMSSYVERHFSITDSETSNYRKLYIYSMYVCYDPWYEKNVPFVPVSIEELLLYFALKHVNTCMRLFAPTLVFARFHKTL